MRVAPGEAPTKKDISRRPNVIGVSSTGVAPLVAQEKDPCGPISFRDVFGFLGIPIVVIVVGCLAWTLWLLILSLAPNDAANFLMDTSELDGGQFWLIPDEWSILQTFSVAGLALVLLFYVYILLKIIVWRSQKNLLERTIDKFLDCWRAAARSRAKGASNATFSQKTFCKSWEIYVFWKELTNIHGEKRKFWNVCLKIQDLVMLSLLLHDLLEAGTPVDIAYGLSVMAALNSFLFAGAIFFSRCSALVEILVDAFFDFGSTVLYPVIVLYYCTRRFQYNRAVYLINLEFLPVGSFERRARMYANPAEIALVRAFFDSLRIQDWTDFSLRIGMNLSFSYRLKRILEVLIEMGCESQKQQPQQQRSMLRPPECSASMEQVVAHQRLVPKSLALLFIIYSVGVVVITYETITTSQMVCSPHPECVVFAYRWRTSELCPCRTIIAGNPAPMTYFEWTNPVDVTKTVSALAAAGTLETLQLINLQLTVLPQELRGCHNLKFFSLINCATEKLPSWMKEFSKLEYLQIEGKVGSANLGDLAPDLFTTMTELSYLQLGIHPRMLHLPPLDGAPKLRSIVFSRLYNLVQIPVLTRQTRLERLELTSCTSIASLPDLASATSLRYLIILQGAHLCCNGFLGTCDLTNPFCNDATCLEDPIQKAVNSTLQAFETFSDSVCQPFSGLSQVPTTETIQMCDGVPFRQCHLPNTAVVGMCYNHRMQVLACNPDPSKIRVRRRQIEDAVGAPCDPIEEAWLGCPAST